eukprot:5431032-Alexandrium_andersonii.AAC.1
MLVSTGGPPGGCSRAGSWRPMRWEPSAPYLLGMSSLRRRWHSGVAQRAVHIASRFATTSSAASG